jgi:hypothetical protein
MTLAFALPDINTPRSRDEHLFPHPAGHGSTAGHARTWNRPVAMLPPPPSGVGTNVAYEVTPFSVTLDGAYSLLMERTGAFWDTYLFLYASNFDPTMPFDNRIAANDDCQPFTSFDRSCFDIGLTAGVQYFAVATGFANIDFGTYDLTIRGPGDINIGDGTVPEPASLALALLALGAAGASGAASRRRTR